MNNIKSEILELKEEQLKLEELRKSVAKEEGRLSRIIEQNLKDELKEKFPNNKIEIFVPFPNYFHYSNWETNAGISYIDDCKFTDRGYWVNRTDNSKKEKVNIDMAEVVDFCNKFKEKYGVYVGMNYISYQTKKEDIPRIRNVEDLENFLINTKLEIIHKGKISYKNWDCPDIFFITKVNDVYRLFLSTSAYGFGVDYIISKDMSIEDIRGSLRYELNWFFNKISQDKENKALKKQYFKDICDNWCI